MSNERNCNSPPIPHRVKTRVHCSAQKFVFQISSFFFLANTGNIFSRRRFFNGDQTWRHRLRQKDFTVRICAQLRKTFAQKSKTKRINRKTRQLLLVSSPSDTMRRHNQRSCQTSDQHHNDAISPLGMLDARRSPFDARRLSNAR